MPYEIHVRTESGKLYPLPDACDNDGKPVSLTARSACIFIEGLMELQKMDASVPMASLFVIGDFHLKPVGDSTPVTLCVTEHGRVGALYDQEGVFILSKEGGASNE